MSGIQTDGINFDVLTTDPATPDEAETWYSGADDHIKANVSNGANERVVLITQKRTSLTFSTDQKVPSSGTLWFSLNSIATSVPTLILA